MRGNSTTKRHPPSLLELQSIQLRHLLVRLIHPPINHPFPEIELSIRDIMLLRSLNPQNASMMTDLATAIQAPLSTVTRMVDRLEAKGVIERQRSSKDRRIVLVQETRVGKKLREAFLQNQLQIAHSMLEPLALDEREILLKLMTKLLSRINEPPF